MWQKPTIFWGPQMKRAISTVYLLAQYELNYRRKARNKDNIGSIGALAC